MGNIIDGKGISAAIRDEVREEVAQLKRLGKRVPGLCVIIVGDDPASRIYVRNKIKAAECAGIVSTLLEYPSGVAEDELLDRIAALNSDPAVDGILVQLPLPGHISEEKVIDAIDPLKDVDGFHPANVADLWLGRDCIAPCTPAGIIVLLDSIGYDLAGKNAVVVGRSNIVGKPVAKLLLDRNATVTVAHSRTADLGTVTRTADVLVTAVGKAGLIRADMLKPGAVVLDVGMNQDASGHLCGDVDFCSCREVASWITPVPGGVGPMTIAMLMKNCLHCYRLRSRLRR